MNQVFSPLITGNSLLDRIQANIRGAFNALFGSSPFLGGQLIQNIKVLSASATQFPTGLSRVPQIWVICDQQTNAVVWRTAWDQNTITLQSSADCTMSIWVS